MFRIAPTPSGYLHKGNVFNIILNALYAQYYKKPLRLRIDDLDKERRRMEYIEDIFFTIDWLGIALDLGPSSPYDFIKNYSQDYKIDHYRHIYQQFFKKESYACRCSRSAIKKRKPCGYGYDGFCRNKNLNQSQPFNLRLKHDPNTIIINSFVENYALNSAEYLDDFIIWKKDDRPAYHLASLIDDIDYGIEYIIRGQDLFSSTVAQLYAAKYISKESFSNVKFLHHPLILGMEGEKLSKSKGDLAVFHYRESKNGLQTLLSEFTAWFGLEEVYPEKLVDIYPIFVEKVSKTS